MNAVNRNFVKNTSCAKKQDRRKKPTRKREMQKFYSIQMLLENTHGNATRDMRVHFQQLKREYRTQWPCGLGYDRFIAIRSNLVLSREEIQQLCQLLHRNFCQLVNPNSVSIILILYQNKNLQQF